MIFTLTLNCDSDAFADGNTRTEIIRILRIAQIVLEDKDVNEYPLRDKNGNTVGGLELSNEV